MRMRAHARVCECEHVCACEYMWDCKGMCAILSMSECGRVHIRTCAQPFRVLANASACKCMCVRV